MADATITASRKAEALEDTLLLLNKLTSEAGTLLVVLSQSLGELRQLTEPIHNRATVMTVAHSNIAATKQSVDELLERLDTFHRVRPCLDAGPATSLDAFLDALQQLEQSNVYLMERKGLAVVRTALGHSQLLFDNALQQCEADFMVTLQQGMKACAPSLPWLTRAASEPVTGCLCLEKHTLQLGSTLFSPSAERGHAVARAEALVVDLVPHAMLQKLARMAGLLLGAEYMPVLDSYTATREAALQQLLRGCGQEPMSQAALATLPSDGLERVVQNWVMQLRTLVILMYSEQHLADGIWPAPYNAVIFANVVASHIRALAAAGGAVAALRRSSDMLFHLLAMAQGLEDTMGPLRAVLGASGQPSALLVEMEGAYALVSSVSAALLAEYEEVVARDSSRVVVADGTVHPLCAQVLSYLKRLLTHENAAEVLFGACKQNMEAGDVQSAGKGIQSATTGWEAPASFSRGGARAAIAELAVNRVSKHAGTSDDSCATPTAQLRCAVMRVLLRLLDNLDSKAHGYRNEALAALFMMNNVHYIVWSVESSPVLSLLGVDWLERHKDLVEEAGARYHDLVWMPLVRMLQAEAPPSKDMARTKSMLKDRYTRFNEAIDGIYALQSQWTIPDQMLRTAVKRVIKDDLLGPYQEFLRKYADVAFTSNPAKYIRYSASDLASIVDDDLFEGKAASPAQKLSLRKEKLDSFS